VVLAEILRRGLPTPAGRGRRRGARSSLAG
jgi:hypothetical protein